MKYLLNTTLLLLALFMPTAANAHDFEVDGIYYNILNGNEVEVTHKGSSVYDNEYSGNVMIPETVIYGGTTYTVTAIGRDAFSQSESLTYVTIPNSVTAIGLGAFYNCSDLTNIVIPNSVTSMDDEVFNGCRSLKSIELPNTLSSIGAFMFCGCSSLTNIVIPNSIIYIDESAFEFCTSLTSIEIPNSVISIETRAFDGCSNLTSVVIPNSVTSIGFASFYQCSSLSYIEIPNTAISIGEWAFLGTAWYENQPDGMVYAGLSAYKYKGIMPENTSIVLRDSTRSISAGAFYDCSGLTNIEIPNSVVIIGGSAFDGTTWYDIQPDGLVYAGLVAYKYKGTMPEGTNITLKNGTLGISEFAFGSCRGLTSIIIPNSVTYIGEYAFWNSGLTSIVIPNSVKSIRYGMVDNCTELRNIVIGDAVISIDNYSFSRCYEIENIYCYAEIPSECKKYSFPSFSATLHVPAASLAAYFTAPVWCNFENIVGDAVAPTGISISRDSVEAYLGEQFELVATVTPENASNKIITWYSTDTTVATVEDGIVTAVGFGECDIYAYCFGMPAICHVSVTQRISLDQQEVMLLPNHILTLTPSALPTLPNLSVASSDATVAAARVMNGKVQVVGVAEGTATITVGSADGLAVPATCLVTVYTEKGDVNMDGFVNISDVTRTISYVLSGNDSGFKFANADLNGDGRVNVSDVTALISRVLTTTE